MSNKQERTELQDHQLAKAVASILQRSEKQQDLQKLVGTFVDVGILRRIEVFEREPRQKSRNNCRAV